MSDVVLVLVVIGVSVIAFGAYVRMGGGKRLYVIRMIPVIAPQAYKNALIPAGAFIILLGLWSSGSISGKIETFLDYAVFLSFLATIILGVLSPRWLKPRWLVYLEDTYGGGFTYAVLLPTAGKDPRGWEQQMRTLEDVKGWAARVAKQHDFPLDLSQFDGKV